MFRWSPVMMRMAAVCAALLGVSLIGLVVDDRVITGAPAWLKPAKFGASTAIYLLTMTWMVRDLPASRTVRVSTWIIAWLLALETTVIAIQAARGTTSHFNINTPLDIALYSTMGVGIATVWILSAVLLWIHLRTPASDHLWRDHTPLAHPMVEPACHSPSGAKTTGICGFRIFSACMPGSCYRCSCLACGGCAPRPMMAPNAP
jgi:hypothetical protein